MLARGRGELKRVQDRKRENDLLFAGVAACGPDRPFQRAPPCRGREAVGVALDDDRVGRERNGEEARRPLAGLDRLGVARDEAPQRERLAASEPRQGEHSRRPRRRSSPDDEGAQANDEPGKRGRQPFAPQRSHAAVIP